MKQLGYNINIMNDKGIIIASGDPNRIGDFHEIAYKIIKNKLDIQMAKHADDDYIGVKPGVNMPIIYEDEIIGVIGISGEPDEIMNFAHIVRMSVETMIEYEFYKDQITKRQNNKNVFLNSLLYQEPVNPDKIETLAKDLDYDGNIVRVPVLIKLSSNKDSEYIIKIIKNSPSHTRQDISFALTDGNIVIFKCIKQNDIKNYKSKILQYINDINNLIVKELITSQCYYFIGSIQNKLKYYRHAFLHTLWLEKHMKKMNRSVYFFMDYIFQYMQDIIAFDTYESIFSVFQNAFDDKDKQNLIETLEALYESNMNLNKTAELLYLHRNTILFRLNKIKDQLGINPVKNIYDRQFLYQLLYFYKKTQNK